MSNVTVYYVVITPDMVPGEFRSGMSASIEIVEKEKKNVLLIPRDSVITDGGRKYVLIKKRDGMQPEKREFIPGLESDKDVEVTGGIGINDIILIAGSNMDKAETSSGKNPFMPEPPGAKKK